MAFKETSKFRYLLTAVWLVVSQGRLLECFYCLIIESWRLVKSENNLIRKEKGDIIKDYFVGYKLFYIRTELKEKFNDDYCIDLPEDFLGARRCGVVIDDDFIIIGEYGNQKNQGVSRIYIFSDFGCFVIKKYLSDKRVKHIHAIHLMQDKKSLLVTVGDGAKYLDLWRYNEGSIVFIKRIKKYFAGYMAIAEYNGKIYFGTDFSSRVNYIEIFKGKRRKKILFPEKALRCPCQALEVFDNQYIYALSIGMGVYKDYKVLSVFDIINERFVYCDFCDI
jgi:hypothetical protein